MYAYAHMHTHTGDINDGNDTITKRKEFDLFCYYKKTHEVV